MAEDIVDFDTFCELVAGFAGVAAERVKASESFLTDLHLDELSLATMLFALQDLNPYFELPDQMATSDLTVRDVYHYYRTMTRGHVPQNTEEAR
jgi:hypothetical protein